MFPAVRDANEVVSIPLVSPTLVISWPFLSTRKVSFMLACWWSLASSASMSLNSSSYITKPESAMLALQNRHTYSTGSDKFQEKTAAQERNSSIRDTITDQADLLPRHRPFLPPHPRHAWRNVWPRSGRSPRCP